MLRPKSFLLTTAIFSLLWCFIPTIVKCQVTTLAPGEYKSIIIPSYSVNLDYTRCLILMHEAYAQTPLNSNFAIGTLTALRGSVGGWNRVNIANVNSAAAYMSTTANVTSFQNNANEWKLKTCMFNGKKYLALEVPYTDSYHDHGYKFFGWTSSTGENMLCVPYMVNGNAVNGNVLSDIQDFSSNQIETHDVAEFNVLGNVGIGTTAPKEKLSVNGKIRAKEVKVEVSNWPDYVFAKNYTLPSLKETERQIREQGHLPGIPSAAEVKSNGIDLGTMNSMLLKKIEELTVYLIKLNDTVDEQQREIKKLKTKRK